MLEAKEVTIEAGGRMLASGLSFVAEAGRVTCLTGARGVGQTVLVRSLLGLWPVARGYVTLQGEPMTPRSAPWLRRWFCYVPQALPEADGESGAATEPTEASPLAVLRQLDVEDKRVLLVDDPFSSADEAEAVAEELFGMAASGLAVVVACSEADAAAYLPMASCVPLASDFRHDEK